MIELKEIVFNIWNRLTSVEILNILKEIFYFLSIILLLLGIKELRKKDKQKPKIYKPSAVRTVNNALNPMEQAEQIIFYEKKIEKGVRKMIRWIKNNKGAIATVLSGLVTIASYIYASIDSIYVLWGVEIVPVACTVITLIVGVLTNKFTSSNFQEAVNQLAGSLKANKVDKETVSDIKYFTSEISRLEKELSTLEKNNALLVTDYERKKRFDLPIEVEMQTEYSAYLKAKAALKAQIESYKGKLGKLKSK